MTNYYNEFEPKAAAGLRALIEDGLIPPGEVDTRSIVDVRANDLKGFTQCHFFAGKAGWSRALYLAGWPATRPVWTGSCPCQPFSAAGKGQGGADNRHLWPVWFDLIREARALGLPVPTIFGEQVASAVSHGWLDRVFVDMESEGYALGASVLPACSVNAPHKRDRLWFSAYDSSGGTGGGVGLADTAKQGLPEWRGCAVGQPAQVKELERLRQAGNGNRGLANPGFGRCGESGEGEIQFPRGAETVRSSDGNMAHAESQRSQQGQSHTGGCGQGGTEGQITKSIGGDGCDGVNLVDAIGFGGCGGNHQGEHAADVNPSSERDGRGFWDGYEWILCADGKARRIPTVESGIRILAYGIPERVGLLRVAGNAIVPEVAARFIIASDMAWADTINPADKILEGMKK